MTTLETWRELQTLNEYVDDSDLTEALDVLLKLIEKPDVPAQVAVPLIVKLQAISGKLRLMAAVETHIYKTDRARKNLLYSTTDVIDNLVAALKYLVR